MELTKKQLTEELVITPEAMKQAIEDIDEMLSQDKAMDILVAILEDVQPQLEEYKKEHKKHPAPITLYLWITRQAYLMGYGCGIDVYSDTVKGFIGDYFGGYMRKNSRTLLQASTGQNNASEGGIKIMYDKAAYNSLVTSDEAIELSQFRTLKDVYIAKDIYQKCIEKDKDDICYSRALGIVWNAGRMQGIREEREKRR